MDTLSGSNQNALFVTVTGEIYINSGATTNNVDKWTLDPINKTGTFDMGGACDGLFIDINRTLYCCIRSASRVFTKSLNSNTSLLHTLIGTTSSGSSPDQLNSPQGLFVSVSFSVYVADVSNARIQRFEPGQANGTTIAGNGAPSTLSLNQPTGVALDSDDYLFIADTGNNRIVGSGPNGFRCVAGCSVSNQLNGPQSLAFDSYGNIYVTDGNSARVQKFSLATNSCSESIERVSLYSNIIFRIRFYRTGWRLVNNIHHYR